MAKTKATKGAKAPSQRRSRTLNGEAIVFQMVADNPKRKGSDTNKLFAWMSGHLPATVGYLEDRFVKRNFHSTLGQELKWDTNKERKFLSMVRPGDEMPDYAFNKRGELLEVGAAINGTTVTFTPGATYNPPVSEDDSEADEDESVETTEASVSTDEDVGEQNDVAA